jgi:signal transduction histidine kinase/CheY-like chemotaxis protein
VASTRHGSLWCERLSIRTAFALIGVSFVSVCAGLLAVSWYAIDVMSSVRAYVGGEGRWSKAQNKAVDHLMRFLASRDEAEFQSYKELLRVPLGDRRARIELERDDSDLATADAAFLEGDNHRADVRGMSLLFKRFRRVSYLDRAIRIWARGDALLAELDGAAERLHTMLAAGSSDSREIDRLKSQIDRVDRELGELEDEFSFTLGEAARWIKGVLVAVILGSTVLFFVVAWVVARMLSRGIFRRIERLQRGTALIGTGDLSHRVAITSKDELGQLAVSFNRMAESLLASNDGLTAARQQAVEASRIKSQFLANMSHEIRTPLNGIIGMVTLMLDGELTQTQARDVKILRDSSRHLLDIVNDILDISKIESGKLEIARVPLDLRSTLEEVVNALVPLAQNRGIELRRSIASEVVDERWGDPVRIRQVLNNLVGNAIKFTDEGSVSIAVSHGGSKSEVVIRIEDTGIGMDSTTLEKIFRPFVQADESNRRKRSGTGLGLAISRQLVEMMGGAIAVESELGRGSVFEVRCPLDLRAPAEIESSEKSRPDIREPAKSPRRLRVLVVDDNAVNRLIAKRMVTRMGHVVVEAVDGRRAVEITGEQDFDVVLMDVQMPELDGIEATQLIRTRDPNRRLPVIALTAHAMAGDEQRFRAAGMDAYLTKPIDVRALERELTSIRAGS